MTRIRDTWTPFLQTVLQRRPYMNISDLYKLLHQAHMGIGHLIGDSELAAVFLDEELQRVKLLERDDGDVLWEPIRPDGKVGRVHLRALCRQNLNSGTFVASLIDAMIQFSQEPPASIEQLTATWAEVHRSVQQGKLPFCVTEFEDFSKEVEQLGYPARHHSSLYREKYYPAYRILDRTRAAAIFSPIVSAWNHPHLDPVDNG